MMGNRYVRILVVLGMVAVLCGTVSAVTGIVAETQRTSVGEYPVCTAPCECIAKSTAAMRWGAEGYELCNKNICGQTADGMVQYYCLHQVGSIHQLGNPDAAPAVTTTAPAAVSQETVQAPVQTQVSSAEVPANPSPSSAWPSLGGIIPKTPVGSATILAAVGASLLVAAGTRRK
jgi:hypothetical protein